MSALTAQQRGDLAEKALPVAARLACIVHGDGGPEEVAEVLAGLDPAEKDALIVVLAGLVDPEQPVGKALGWLDFNEHGSLTVPSWSEDCSVRDLAPEPGEDVDDDYVDQVAVDKFVRGLPVEVTDAEFLAAVSRLVAMECSLADIDRLRGWRAKTAETWVNRLRKRYQRAGRHFPSLVKPTIRTLTEGEVVAIRERCAAGATDLEVAMSFGVSHKTVGEVCRGKRYAQFGGPLREAKQVQHLPGTRQFMCGHADNSRAAGNRDEMKKVA